MSRPRLSQKGDHPNFPGHEDGWAYDYDYQARFSNGENYKPLDISVK